MASGANYSPLREEPPDQLELIDDSAITFQQDDGPYPNAGNPRVRSAGRRRPNTGCSKCTAVMLVCLVLTVIVLVAVIASLARPKCVGQPSIASSAPPSTASTPAAVTTPSSSTGWSTTAKPLSTSYGEPCPWTSIRLPESVKPRHYDLTITTDLPNSNVDGVVTVDLEVVTSTDMIVLHTKGMTIDQPRGVTAIEGGQTFRVQEMVRCDMHEQVVFILNGELTPGVSYSLTLTFSYKLSDEALSGYYRSSYIENGQEKFIASTQFEPTSARQAFPCFDEPALKATFAMKMIHAKEYISLFNTALINATLLNDKTVKDHFNTTVPMSTYLVAFVVCDFAKISNVTSDGTEISVYTSQGKIGQASLALDVLKKTIPFYENFFGISYPLSKQDMIGIPDFSAGAMENWGLITYREASLLFKEGETPSSQKQWVVETITHELAHQWFGNLVTMEWWNDLWLNEGFASYVQYIGSDKYNPNWHMMEQFTVYTTQAALHADSYGNSHPISVDVKDPNEINEIFDSISYDKGSAIIRMLHDFLPPQVFVNGLKYYLTKFQFKNAQTKDLWDAIAKAYANYTISHATVEPLDVADMMNTWTLQLGYPVVMLTRKGTRITAKQKHFLLSPNSRPAKEFISPYNYTWTIPFTYRTSNDMVKRTIKMDKNLAEVQFDLTDSGILWYKGNSEQSGFYRVNYDSDNWAALIRQLKNNHTKLSALDRAHLIDDAFSLAWADQLNQTVPLDLSLYLLKETEFSPLISALGNLNRIGHVMRNSEGYSVFVDYILKVLMPKLEYFSDKGWNAELGHLQGLLQTTVIHDGVLYRHENTVKNATKLFDDWRDSGTPVPANLKAAVYCAGIMYGTRKDWDFCWNQFKTTLIASEERVLLEAMACTVDPYLINRYLYWSMDDDKIPSQDTGIVISNVASHPAGAHAALAFVIDKWDTLVMRFQDSPFEIEYVIHAVTRSISREFEYDEASKFFQNHLKDSSVGKRTVEQAIEHMQANMDWLAAHEDDVTAWFKAHTATS